MKAHLYGNFKEFSSLMPSYANVCMYVICKYVSMRKHSNAHANGKASKKLSDHQTILCNMSSSSRFCRFFIYVFCVCVPLSQSIVASTRTAWRSPYSARSLQSDCFFIAVTSLFSVFFRIFPYFCFGN